MMEIDMNNLMLEVNKRFRLHSSAFNILSTAFGSNDKDVLRELV